MQSFNTVKKLSSWLVFAIALIVYYFSAERTGSLWDCGEFILGAYKLEVVHPPGAPLFMIIGRMFTWVATLISDNPANIAFAVNLMSSMATAFAAFFVSRITMLFGHHILVGDSNNMSSAQNLAIGFGGLAAGLATAFSSSIWFSAVEGEVYAMSTFFTAVTFWASTKWYTQPDEGKNDRWLALTAYIGGLSIGVHLLSLLTFPAIGLMYYLKKKENPNLIGSLLALAAGSAIIIFIQKFVIVGIPTLWKNFELFAVNSMGLPIHSGLVITLILLVAGAAGLLYFTHKGGYRMLNLLTVCAILVSIGFSTIGVIVIRANADTPINMNVPSDAMRLLPYLNREQYGERALLHGPHFKASPKDLTKQDRYGRVGDKYVVVDEKLDYVYANKDKILLPRVGHTDGPRPQLHDRWYRQLNGGEALKGAPGMKYNMQFLMSYQMGWMYWRYFYWNFVGKQNGTQGYYSWDVSDGNWLSGIKPIDELRLHEMDYMPDSMKNNKANNKYYFLPLIFGLVGLFFLFRKDKKIFSILMILFLITGLGLIMYSNQPPNEPRERDYVLVGSFFTYCIFIGMGVLGLFQFFQNRLKLSGSNAAILGGVLVMIAPILMGTQNFDDHSRMNNYGSRDYAANFLNSVDENAIIFTYGDNDTYPLWYAQEVENIRRDVRVVNLSLIAVDWYIEKLRNKVNDSEPIKLSIPPEAYRGKNRNQVFFFNPENREDLSTPMNAFTELNFIASPKNNIQGQTIMRSRNLYIPLDLKRLQENNLIGQVDSTTVNRINVKLPKKGYITKDELAVLDLVCSNIHDRKIYFAVTCNNDKLLGMNDYMQLEGLALRLVPEYQKSDQKLSIYGSGSVENDKLYENIMNKWAWGNFDKEECFIDDSYAAELQAMRIVMMRGAQSFLRSGDKEKAGALANEYFKGFPNFNFTYDESVTPFLNILAGAGDYESAKKHARILANELAQRMAFYDSLDEDDFESSFRQDFQYALRGIDDVLALSKDIKDPEFRVEMEQLLGPYDVKNLKN